MVQMKKRNLTIFFAQNKEYGIQQFSYLGNVVEPNGTSHLHYLIRVEIVNQRLVERSNNTYSHRNRIRFKGNRLASKAIMTAPAAFVALWPAMSSIWIIDII